MQINRRAFKTCLTLHPKEPFSKKMSLWSQFVLHIIEKLKQNISKCRTFPPRLHDNDYTYICLRKLLSTTRPTTCSFNSSTQKFLVFLLCPKLSSNQQPRCTTWIKLVCHFTKIEQSLSLWEIEKEICWFGNAL